MLPLNLRQLGATYYTGNCHKWICAPKTAAFLNVPKEKQRLVRPLIISHGANSPRTDRSRFLIEFSWMGTSNPTPCLTVSEALHFMSTLHPKGWPGLMERNRELALEARKLLCQSLQVPLPCPPEMVGSMAAMPLPPCPVDELSTPRSTATSSSNASTMNTASKSRSSLGPGPLPAVPFNPASSASLPRLTIKSRITNASRVPCKACYENTTQFTFALPRSGKTTGIARHRLQRS